MLLLGLVFYFVSPRGLVVSLPEWLGDCWHYVPCGWSLGCVPNAFSVPFKAGVFTKKGAVHNLTR